MTAAEATKREGVLVIGSYNRDLVFTVPHLPAPGETLAATGSAVFDGGKGSNQAVQAARCGSRVGMVAALGADAAGAAARMLWQAEGITAFSVESALPTGQAVILVDAEGENSIVVASGANVAVSAAQAAEAVAGFAPRVVLAQLETPPEASLAGFAAARARGALTLLNAAPARLDLPASLLDQTDLLICNEGEAAAVAAQPARHRLGMVVTLGAAGVRHVAADGGATDFPAFPVSVADSTGAGDAFTGCLAAMLAAEMPMSLALVHALAAGALACTRPGAVPALASLAAIRALAAPRLGG